MDGTAGENEVGCASPRAHSRGGWCSTKCEPCRSKDPAVGVYSPHTTREHQLLSSSEPQETDIPSDGMTQIGSQSLSAAGLRAENWKVLSLLHPIPPLNTGEADSSPTSDQT